MENKQNEQPKITNVNNKELNYLGIEKVDRNYKQEISKIYFKVSDNKGNQFKITLKNPKTTKQSTISGVPVEDVVPMTMDDLIKNPVYERLEALRNALGSVKMNTNYSYIEGDNDGELVKYRFIRSLYAFKPIIEEQKVEEQDLSKENY